MDKMFLQKQKNKLEERKTKLEQDLRKFAKKDPNIKGNWETKFPDFGIRTADSSEQTDQIEEYEATLSVEYTLETKLKEIEQALGRIKKDTYGTCQKCGKKVKIERLKAYPEASLCIKCTKGGK